MRLVSIQNRKFMGHLTLVSNGKLSRIEREHKTLLNSDSDT